METLRSNLDINDSDSESFVETNEPDLNYLKIDVIDTGVGITEDD